MGLISLDSHAFCQPYLTEKKDRAQEQTQEPGPYLDRLQCARHAAHGRTYPVND